MGRFIGSTASSLFLMEIREMILTPLFFKKKKKVAVFLALVTFMHLADYLLPQNEAQDRIVLDIVKYEKTD